MNKFENLFCMFDKLGMVGFFGMWLSFFTTSFVVLLADDTQGPMRDFCAASQLLCCTNLVSMGWAITNNVGWSKASFLTLHFDTFGTLLAFAYYGGGDVLDSSPLGVWNTMCVVGTAMNTVFGVAALYCVAKDYKGFHTYLKPAAALTLEIT